MSLLEGMSVTLEEGSTISFEEYGNGWEVSTLAASDKLIEALGPHLMEAKDLVLNCFNILVHDAPSLPEPQTQEEEDRLSMAAMEHLIFPFLRLEPVDGASDIMQVGVPVRLMYTVEDGKETEKSEDFELLVSTVVFAIEL